MKAHKKLVWIFCLFFLLSIIAGCGSSNNNQVIPNEKEPVKIGIINSLSGAVSSYGTSCNNGILLALDEVNNKGGILDGRMISYIVEDDQGKIEDASTAAQKLINQDEVVAIIGATISSCSNAVASSAQAAGVPMITATSTAKNVTEDKDFVSRVCFLDPYQAKPLAEFAINELGANKAAILYNNQDDYSSGLAESFKQEYIKLGGIIVDEQTYGKGEQDFNGQLTAIKGTNPDVLYLPDYYNTVGLIAKQAKQQGITATLLGADGWDFPQLFEIGGDAVEGAIYTCHFSADDPTAAAKEFVQAYQEKYEGKAPDSFAALGYDAAKLLINAIESAGELDKVKIKEAINNTKDFNGVTGNITLDENRNPIKSVVIVKIEEGQQVFVNKVMPE